MLKFAINKIVDRQNLTQVEAQQVMELIMSGQTSPEQIAALITGLRMKGETVDEVTGFAQVMRDKATSITTKHDRVIDTCGTGGDGANTFNISTTTAFVLAGLGIPVAKHGNRSVSSKCGSADLLEAIGVNLSTDPQGVSQCLDEVGIGFLYAPALHGAMKYAVGPRKEIGIRTIFNILGPLTNPARAKLQLMGVYLPELTEMLAEVLARLGTTRALVLHGQGGLDEASIAGETKVTEVHQGQIQTYVIEPEDFGIQRMPVAAIVGGAAQDNALITTAVLQGQPGPHRNVVILNAALGIKAAGITEDLREAANLAQVSLDSGAAYAKLEQLVICTNKLASGL